MHRIHWTRALIVLTLIGTLAALPATAQAAVRADDGDGDQARVSLVRVVVDWVSEQVRNIWGAGGPEFDPSGHKPPANVTEEGSPDSGVRPDEDRTANSG